MMRFPRREPPAFWAAREARWIEHWRAGDTAGRDPLRWEHEGRTLAQWFHGEVRGDAARLCIYCDDRLGTTSPANIDHFLPASVFGVLAIHWHNLYPACTSCNSTYKGARWHCRLLRPDIDFAADDDFDDWFRFEPQSGRLLPAPSADRKRRARVRLTLRVLRLNRPEICLARIDYFKDLVNTDAARLEQACVRGPYRFIARGVRAYRRRAAVAGSFDAS
jgi:uncharacterized protein (TIGR02646 family)